MAKSHTYKWAGEYPAILSTHSTPDGSGVRVEPGQEFTTSEPFEHPFALPATSSKSSKTEESAHPVVAEETAQ